MTHKNIQQTLHKIFCPKAPLGPILGILCIVPVGFIFLLHKEEEPIAYVCFLLSAYGFVLIVTTVLVPAIRALKKLLRKNPHIDRYFADRSFKSRVNLYMGLCFNIAFAIYKMGAGFISHSYWLIAIGTYYISLCLIKFVLVGNDVRTIRRQEKESELREWKAYRAAGCMLMPLNLVLAGIMFFVVWRGNSYSYPGTLIFAMAFYVFYRVTMAIVRLVKNRNHPSPILSAAMMIDLMVAVVALYALQTAMLSAFGAQDHYFMAVMNSTTGIVALVVVLGIATYMIIHGTRRIREL